MSKKQLVFLALALLVGSFFGFLVGNFAVTTRSAATGKGQMVTKTVTVTQFNCNSTNYEFEIGSFCLVDKLPLTNQPASMSCMAAANFSNPSFTLSEKCDPNGSLIGNPFFVAWRSGYLELLLEDGTYNFNPPRVVTYSAVK